MNCMLIKVYKKLQHDLKHIEEILFYYGMTPLSNEHNGNIIY